MNQFRLLQGNIDYLLSSTTGPVGQEIQRRTIKGETQSKRLAPWKTGRLRSSITHEVSRDDRGLYGRWGTNVEYALFQEFGTRHMPAHPFLRPALMMVAR